MTREPELIDAYGILEVEIGAPEPAVRAAYHARLDVWHPDKHPNDRERAETACDRIVGAFALIERNGFPPANQVPPKLSRVPTPRPGTPRPATPLPRAASQPGEPRHTPVPMRAQSPVSEPGTQASQSQPSMRAQTPASQSQPGMRAQTPASQSQPGMRATTPPPSASQPGLRAQSPVSDRMQSQPGPRAQSPVSDRMQSQPGLRAQTPPPVAVRQEDLATDLMAEPLPLPGARVRGPLFTRRRVLHGLLWLVIALPALYQIGLLITAIAGRIGYPYDLEWMEGGMLHHALRIQNGEGIYVAPNIDFIPYLYTPLYPTLLAVFGKWLGISYTLGRTFSVLALLGIGGIAGVSIAHPRHQHLQRGPVFAGVVLALGLFAAIYPYVEGWYDLVRADTFFLFMVTAALAGLPRWSRSDVGLVGHGKVAAGAALMALAFFCKQTGIFYVALGGVIVLVHAWRRAPTYAAMAGLIGLGGTWALNRSTHGWFWTYISEIHRAHDFNMDRFWKSFGNILWHFPALTIVVVIALLLVAATWWRTRRLPPQVQPLLLWSSAFAVSTVVGAIGWGTEFAHYNAYMPAFLHGALAAGAAIPAILACGKLLAADRPRADLEALGLAVVAALPLALACWNARWQPQQFIPTAADVAAGNRLIERIKSIDGDVWMPSHPWYLVLAGKTPHVHRMGIKDVTTRQDRFIEGLDDKLKNHEFTALVLDDRDLQLELPVLHQYYRPAFVLPVDERPRVYTGAKVVPEAVWIPSIPATPPPNAKVVFDFEAPTWTDGWVRTGTAWGGGPVTETQPGQNIVLGATGTRFATSVIGGNSAVGRVTSPLFSLDGAKLTLRLGGGTDATKLRVELWVDDQLAKTASVPEPGGDMLHTVTIEVGDLRGRLAKLVFVDDSPTGHLDVDDVWLWQ